MMWRYRDRTLLAGAPPRGPGPPYFSHVTGPEDPLLHGLDRYWLEQTRFRRRLAACLLIGAALALLPGLLLALRPEWRQLIDEPQRFGFEGPTQWVERIRLEAIGPEASGGLSALDYITQESRRGGRSEDRDDEEGRPVVQRDTPGPGLDVEEWNARARLMRLDAPIIRTEELVALHLEQPEYPREAYDNDIEGVVEMLAMIDTLGAVRQVQVFGGTRDSLFERAAIDAAFQNRYRPYLQHESPVTVWVPLRYAFTIHRRP